MRIERPAATRWPAPAGNALPGPIVSPLSALPAGPCPQGPAPVTVPELLA